MNYKDKVKVLQNCKSQQHIHQQRFLSSHPAVQKRALERGKTISWRGR